MNCIVFQSKYWFEPGWHTVFGSLNPSLRGSWVAPAWDCGRTTDRITDSGLLQRCKLMSYIFLQARYSHTAWYTFTESALVRNERVLIAPSFTDLRRHYALGRRQRRVF